MSGQRHRSSSQVLDRRTLRRDHAALATILRAGMDVLDVGCGTGAITADIADAVGPGRVLGIDRDAALIARANQRTAGRPNLTFAVGDVLTLDGDRAFDVVTAARTLQWIAVPHQAVDRMAAATRPGGSVVLLDYDHTALALAPTPPESVVAFYAAFLAWRAALGFDNRIAIRLAGLLDNAGLHAIVTSPQHEIAVRGDTGFPAALATWQTVIDEIGPGIVADGHAAAEALRRASHEYATWSRETARSIEVVLTAAIGVR